MPDYLFSYRYFRQHYESPGRKGRKRAGETVTAAHCEAVYPAQDEVRGADRASRKNGNGAAFGNGKGAELNLFRERCGGALRGDGFKW